MADVHAHHLLGKPLCQSKALIATSVHAKASAERPIGNFASSRAAYPLPSTETYEQRPLTTVLMRKFGLLAGLRLTLGGGLMVMEERHRS